MRHNINSNNFEEVPVITMQKPEDTEEIAEGEYDDVLELLGKDAKHLHRMGLFTGIHSHSVMIII